MHCRQSLRFVSPAHRRFPYASTAATASMHGFALHGSVQSVGQCFADVQSVCAEAHMNHVVTARCRIVLASSQCRRRAASPGCVRAPVGGRHTLHNAAFCKACGSRARSALCAAHRFAPYGFTKRGVMQSAPPIGGRRSAAHARAPRAPGACAAERRLLWCGPFFSVSALRARVGRLCQCASRKGR